LIEIYIQFHGGFVPLFMEYKYGVSLFSPVFTVTDTPEAVPDESKF
jgi:hypothetical protein